ncbi:MAG TPA: hypothetical protein VF283_22710 [Bryobacteraceae bacterium]
MQSRIKRALLHLQNIARNLLNTLRDGIAVHRAESGDLQNEQIERALRKVGLRKKHKASPNSLLDGLLRQQDRERERADLPSA